MRLLKLTRSKCDEPAIRINPRYITDVCVINEGGYYHGGTRVSIRGAMGNYYVVTETVEEIDALLEELK